MATITKNERVSSHRLHKNKKNVAFFEQLLSDECFRSCREIKSISEDIKNLYSKVKIGDTKKRFSSVKKSLEDTLKRQNEYVKKLKNSYEKVRIEVEAFHKKLLENLEAAKQATLTQLQDDYKRKDAKITEEINDSKHLLQSLEKLMLELGKMEGNKAQEFVQLKTCEKLVAKREELQKKQQKQSSSITVSFTADSDIKAYFQQIKVLGLVTTGPVSKTLVSEVTPPKIRKVRQGPSSEPVAETSASKAKLSESKAELFTPKTFLYQVTKTTEINVSLPDDEHECIIWGSCLSEDGCLLADNKNRKLKRLDPSTLKVRDCLTLKAGPGAVCSVSHKEVAVSLVNRTVHLVSVADKMTCTRTLTFDHDCWGIAYHNGRLFISDGFKSVYMHDMKGTKLRELSTDASGRGIFLDVRHITVSGAGDSVYVADVLNGLITLDIDGNYRSTLSGKDIQASDVWGVCTDGRNVFVCGYSSGNVIQIGQDNTPLGQIANVEAPVSLCFDSQTNTLYVTCYGDHVTVLQLK